MKFNSSSGQISKVLIILSVIILVLIIATYVILTYQTKQQTVKKDDTTPTTEEPKPVYDTQIGNIRFVVQSTTDLGSVLKGQYDYQTIKTTERFIKVIVGAQNKAKYNIEGYAWDLGNIVDSEGRNYTSINNIAFSFVPQPDLCGSLLKPEFAPVPCVKLYDVSKASKGLKVQLLTQEQNGKKQMGIIDLKLP